MGECEFLSARFYIFSREASNPLFMWKWIFKKILDQFLNCYAVFMQRQESFYYCTVICNSKRFSSVQFSSVAQSCPTLWDPMDCGTPGFPVYHRIVEFTQTHVHWVGDAIQPSHPLLSPSHPAFNLSQYQGLFQWFSSSHQVAKVLEFQLQHQSFQWTPRTDLL